MEQPAAMVLKSLLNEMPEEERQTLYQFLPAEEIAFLQELPTLERHEGQLSPFQQIHWSWFTPLLSPLSSREQRLFLSAFSSDNRESLREALSVEDIEETTELGQEYLQESLLSQLEGVPPFLTGWQHSSPLNLLLPLSKKELMHLIDRLALYDLAAEWRQIVETKTLKKLYSFLSEEERVLLKQISSEPIESPLPKLGLERWDGTEEAFRLLLHKRGLLRLGAALAGEPSSLVWILCHRLDVGRGTRLMKQYEKETKGPLSELVIAQIGELLRNNG